MFSQSSQLYRRSNGARKTIPHPQDEKANKISILETVKEEEYVKNNFPKPLDASISSFTSNTFKSVTTHYVASAINGVLPPYIAPLLVISTPLLMPAVSASKLESLRTQLSNSQTNLTFTYKDGFPPRHAKTLCPENDGVIEKYFLVGKSTWGDITRNFAQSSCHEVTVGITGAELPPNTNVHYSVKEYISRHSPHSNEDGFFSTFCRNTMSVNKCIEYGIENKEDISSSVSALCTTYHRMENSIIEVSTKKLTEEACNDFTTCMDLEFKNCIETRVIPAVKDLHDKNIEFWMTRVAPGVALTGLAVVGVYVCANNAAKIEEAIETAKECGINAANQAKEYGANAINTAKDVSIKILSSAKEHGSNAVTQAKKYSGKLFSGIQSAVKTRLRTTDDSDYATTPPAPGRKKHP